MISSISGLPGWRRSADRTSLQANSLVSGNFTGNFVILGPWDLIPLQETAVLQRLVAQFPTRINRENISKNREFFAGIREFWLKFCRRPFQSITLDGKLEFWQRGVSPTPQTLTSSSRTYPSYNSCCRKWGRYSVSASRPGAIILIGDPSCVERPPHCFAERASARAHFSKEMYKRAGERPSFSPH